MAKLPVVAIVVLVVVVVIGIVVTTWVNGPITETTTSTYYTTAGQTTASTTIAQQELSGSISITSYSCTSGLNIYGDQIYTLHVSGTAIGSENATLGLATNPISGDDIMTCDSWTVIPWNKDSIKSNSCVREGGNPSSTGWTFSVRNMTKSFVDQYTLGRVSVDARENIFRSSGDYTHLANYSIIVQCS